MSAVVGRATRSTVMAGAAVTLAVGGLVAIQAPSDGAVGATTHRVSVNSGEKERFKDSYSPQISKSGRWVVFESAARLVPPDTNGARDIYLRDRQSGTTTWISMATDGGPSTLSNVNPAMTPDGRFIAFEAFADDVVAGDDNNNVDIVVRDMLSGTNEVASLAFDGSQTAAANSWSVTPSISEDGRYVAFQSLAPNLVATDGNNNPDIFVRDRLAGTTEIVSVNASGDESEGGETFGSPSISADGRFVAFQSRATNLVPNDTNENTDVFLRDRHLQTTQRASVGPGGVQANSASGSPAISGNGQFLAFTSNATNLGATQLTTSQGHVFVRDLTTGTNERASVSFSDPSGESLSSLASMSRSGRYVVFQGFASTLVPGDTNQAPDVFVRDLVNDVTRRVSVSSGGVEGSGSSGPFGPAISSNGQHVAFASFASDLVPQDKNKVADVFVRANWAS